MKKWVFVLCFILFASLVVNFFSCKAWLESRFFAAGVQSGKNEMQNQIFSEIMKGYQNGRLEISDVNGSKIVLVPEKKIEEKK